MEVDFPVPHAGKIQTLAVGRPKEGIYTTVEAFGDVGLLAGAQFVDAEARTVAFVAVALHATPRNVLAIGREQGILIVADVSILAVLRVDGLILQAAGVIGLARCCPTFGFAEVARGFRRDVVEKNITVGGSGIIAAYFFATGVGDLSTVGTPRQLFVAAERHHGRFEGFALEKVNGHGDFRTVKVGQERMGCGGDVLIPVLVHQIVDDHAGGFGKVFFFRGNGGVLGDLFDENHALAVRREEEILHIVGFVADLAAVTAIGLHDPKLVAAAFGRKIGDLLFVADFYPHCTAFAVGGSRETLRLFGLEVQEIKHAVRLVLGYTIISDGVYGLRAGCIGLNTADASHSPEGFRSHEVGLQGRGLPTDERLCATFRSHSPSECGKTECGADHKGLD